MRCCRKEDPALAHIPSASSPLYLQRNYVPFKLFLVAESLFSIRTTSQARPMNRLFFIARTGSVGNKKMLLESFSQYIRMLVKVSSNVIKVGGHQS